MGGASCISVLFGLSWDEGQLMCLLIDVNKNGGCSCEEV